jgi:RNA polymerase sigma-70 factor (ECF subfamily)
MVADSGLKQLLFEMRGALLRMLSARGAAPDEAEDLLQELFVRLETQAIGPVGEPKAYLYRMADNLFLDRRRAETRRAAREQRWGEQDNELRPTPERELIGRERLAMVSAALAALPERTVEIFRRFRLDGESQRAIGDSLGISLSAVEKHLQRAYRAVTDIRARLDAENEAPRRPSCDDGDHGS